MELSHQFTVPTGIEETWAHFEDIASVAECFPGAQVTSADGDSFAGSVKVKLGPIALVYNGTGTFVEKDEAAKRFVVDANGKDKRGNGTAGAHVTVTMTESGEQHRRLGRHRSRDHRQAGAVRARRDAGRLGQAARPVRRVPRAAVGRTASWTNQQQNRQQDRPRRPADPLTRPPRRRRHRRAATTAAGPRPARGAQPRRRRAAGAGEVLLEASTRSSWSRCSCCGGCSSADGTTSRIRCV